MTACGLRALARETGLGVPVRRGCQRGVGRRVRAVVTVGVTFCWVDWQNLTSATVDQWTAVTRTVLAGLLDDDGDVGAAVERLGGLVGGDTDLGVFVALLFRYSAAGMRLVGSCGYGFSAERWWEIAATAAESDPAVASSLAAYGREGFGALVELVAQEAGGLRIRTVAVLPKPWDSVPALLLLVCVTVTRLLVSLGVSSDAVLSALPYLADPRPGVPVRNAGVVLDAAMRARTGREFDAV